MLPILRPCLCALTILSTLTAAVQANNPGRGDAEILNDVAVQQALEQARVLLHAAKPGEAVDALEKELPRINGNSTYLRTLREAYRSHIQNLWLENKNDLAKKYLTRLSVLDAAAAKDPALTGASRPTPPKADAVPIPAATAVSIPPAPAAMPANLLDDKAPAYTPVETLIPDPKPLANIMDLNPAPVSKVDPFGAGQKRGGGDSLAWQLQAKAEAEFSAKQYDLAHKLFERAYLADAHTLEASRDHWGYCILHYVGDKLRQPNVNAETLEELRKLINSAIGMSAGLGTSGQQLHTVIEQRRLRVAAGGTAQETAVVKHRGKDASGWHVAESAHFRVLHRNQSETFVEKVARTAEKTWLEMSRKWFGQDGVPWDTKCDLLLHATVEEYSRATGAGQDSPGHASMEIEESSQKIKARRIDLHSDQNGLLETILPRETTHMVLAGMFGTAALPRWADVGIASLTETTSRVGQHRRNLARAQQDKALFNVRDLLQSSDYPAGNRIKAFYAESVVLVEFLSRQHGPTVFTTFLRDGQREGYPAALRKHYGWEFNDLEAHWAQYLAGETSNLAQAP